MAATQLERTNGTPTLTTKCTISVWVKRNGTSIGDGAKDEIIAETYTNDSNYCFLRLDGNDNLQVYGTGITSVNLNTSGVLRDPNAWYHIVAALDSTESANADKVKLYINGIQQTLSGSTFPSSAIGFNNSGSKFNIGKSDRYASHDFDGTMSHYHFIDGTAYPASTFGSTDSVTGQWQINTSPSVTYGDQGFFILKDGNSVTDQSGEGNNLTVSAGTLTNTEDCPSNVFATLNPLYYAASQYTLSQGNNSIVYATDSSRSAFGTIGMTDNLGKFYWEVKIVSDSNNKGAYGICDDLYPDLNATGAFIDYAGGYGYFANGQSYNGGTGASFGNAITTGDIVGVALDMDNLKLYFSKNGTWQNSGDPTSGSTVTGAAYTVAAGKTYLPAIRVRNGTNGAFNFGNGYFGTTAVSSAGTNASGNGIFEYDTPTGYTALSTKGLNL